MSFLRKFGLLTFRLKIVTASAKFLIGIRKAPGSNHGWGTIYPKLYLQ